MGGMVNFAMANEIARHLRKNQTEAETLLWSRLRAKQLAGYRFRRQHPIRGYVVDFVCLEKKLVIELDGSQHVEQASADMVRTASIERDGFRVIRFWNNDVFGNLDGVLEQILSALEAH